MGRPASCSCLTCPDAAAARAAVQRSTCRRNTAAVVSKFMEPPRWSEEQLKADRVVALSRFTELRRDEGLRMFSSTYEELRPAVERALDVSSDLRNVNGDIFRDDPQIWEVFRYICGPPISQEDLWTLVEGPKFKRVPPLFADATAKAIRDVIDPVRFPWVAAGRAPSPEERSAAILATTVLWSAQTLGTSRRGAASLRQETATAEALAEAGFGLDPNRNALNVLDELKRGTYSRERKVAGAKCDVPARLNDGRLLAIECKVSNGPKNGWKRVIREVGGKSDGWRQSFGVQVLTSVVLAGVFDLSCLRNAQDNGVILFWEHNLSPLADFVSAAK